MKNIDYNIICSLIKLIKDKSKKVTLSNVKNICKLSNRYLAIIKHYTEVANG